MDVDRLEGKQRNRDGKKKEDDDDDDVVIIPLTGERKQAWEGAEAEVAAQVAGLNKGFWKG
jgi:hypothetical protein